MKEKVLKRLSELRGQKEQSIANLNALIGAIQENELILKRIEEESVARVPPTDLSGCCETTQD